MKKRIFALVKKSLLILLSCAIALQGCHKHEGDAPVFEHYRNVFVVMQFGFNNLSSDMKTNEKQLLSGYSSPSGNDTRIARVPHLYDDDVLLHYTHFPVTPGNYTSQTRPSLCRVYIDNSGRVAHDTLAVYPYGSGVDVQTVSDVFNRARDLYPADTYGAILSSHGTGWLYSAVGGKPKAVLSSLSSEPDAEALRRSFEGRGELLKSFGDQFFQSAPGATTEHSEIDLPSFRLSIPFKLDYLILDACLMGGIETAYELREKAGLIAFSPCPILSKGFYYPTMLERCFGPSKPDVKAICEDYYDFYQNRYSNHSCTITLIDTDGLERLAAAAKTIIDAHRAAIYALNPQPGGYFDPMPYYDDIQYYYDWDYAEIFCDFRDILSKCGADDSELAELDAALDACVVYKAHTASFQGLQIRRYSGMSMYLPRSRWPVLNTFYRGLEWNMATGLVE